MVVAIYRESTQSSKIGNADGGPQLGQTQTTGKSQLAEIVQGKNGCNVKNVLISVLRNPSGYIVEISVYVIPIMFMHFSIILIIYKKKNVKFNQDLYDGLFHNIENNLRESGLGDVSVNKKMKDFNKLLYDILLKIDESNDDTFKINRKLIIRYFLELNDGKFEKLSNFETYFTKFYE